MILKKGSVMYQGSAQGCIEYFKTVGAPVPAKENPADHFMVRTRAAVHADKGTTIPRSAVALCAARAAAVSLFHPTPRR